ncbi:MAG: hypothetical protein D6735_05750 [Acidobacteria bacterium]|jgi:hypothetical protein|nr:MAG: hypothetical protein D6735_05750 [Acidobacteriota bacterium]
MSSYEAKFPRNLVPITSVLALNASIGIYGIANIIAKYKANLRIASITLIICISMFQPIQVTFTQGLVLSRTDTIVISAQWVSENLPKSARICIGYERLAPRYIPPLSSEDYTLIFFDYDSIPDPNNTDFWRICQYVFINEVRLTPLPEWNRLARFDPVELNHPGRIFGIYGVPSFLMNEGVIIEDFDDPALIDNYIWVYKSEGVLANIADGRLSVTYQNHVGQRDFADLKIPMDVEIKDITEIDETPTTLQHSLSVDWLRVH